MEVLLTGDLRFFVMPNAGEVCKKKIVISGRNASKKEHISDEESEHVDFYSFEPLDENYSRLFQSYDFDCVVYFSSSLDGNNLEIQENYEIDLLLDLCVKNNIPRMICLFSDKTVRWIHSDKKDSPQTRKDTLSLRSSVELCELYGNHNELSILVAYVPYVFHTHHSTDFIGQLLKEATLHKRVHIPFPAEQTCSFISATDLSLFLSRALNDKETGVKTVNLTGTRLLTFERIAKALIALDNDTTVTYEQSPASHYVPAESGPHYGWSATDDLLDHLAEIARPCATYKDKPNDSTKAAKQKLNLTWLPNTLKVLLLVFIVELVIKQIGGTAEFQFIDFRLLYVAAAGTALGLFPGILAAVFASLAILSGIDSLNNQWLTLFYNVENWIPFACYFLIGAVTGYFRSSYMSEQRLLSQKLAQERAASHTLEKLYEESVAHKDVLKEQILNSRDSFGRIFGIVKDLNTLVPEDVLKRSVSVLENVLDNHSIAIYILNGEDKTAFLHSCSKQLKPHLDKVFPFENYKELFFNLKQDEIWCNKKCLKDYPAYCAPLIIQGTPQAVIMVYVAKPHQMALYFKNRVALLSGFIQDTLNKAVAYNNLSKHTGVSTEQELYVVNGSPHYRELSGSSRDRAVSKRGSSTSYVPKHAQKIRN